jgi:hypothetical protein
MTICCQCKKEVLHVRWTEEPDKYVCMDCAPILELQKSVPGATFPFTTMHLNSEHPEAITVKSLRHLRKLENQYGVGSVAWNQDSSRWSEPPQTKTPGRQ